MKVTTICHHAEIELLIPVILLLFCPCGKHALHHLMKVLEVPVPFGMESCRSCLVDPQQHTHFLKHSGLEINNNNNNNNFILIQRHSYAYGALQRNV